MNPLYSANIDTEDDWKAVEKILTRKVNTNKMPLKLYEMTRLSLEPFLPPLYRHVRLRLNEQVKKS